MRKDPVSPFGFKTQSLQARLHLKLDITLTCRVSTREDKALTFNSHQERVSERNDKLSSLSSLSNSTWHGYVG